MAMNTGLKGLLPHTAFAMAKAKSVSLPQPHTHTVPVEPVPVFTDLIQIQKSLADCTRCTLCEGRKAVVVGEGNPHPELMFIGEAPAETEDLEGRPFVGKAGKLLEKMIEAMGVKRGDVFLTNIVKCRPEGNRKPDPSEVSSCAPFLKAQIEILKPKVIVALGQTAASSLLETKTQLSELRGKVLSAQGARLIVTHHPAYLLNQAGAKKEAWEDLKLAMRELGWKP